MIEEKAHAIQQIEEEKNEAEHTEVKSVSNTAEPEKKQLVKAKPKPRAQSVSPRRVKFNAKLEKYRTNKAQKLQMQS